MKVVISDNAPQFVAAMQALVARGEDMAPAMQEIAMLLVDEAEESFQQQRSPITGEPWPNLSPVTIARRSNLGYWPGKMLQQVGRLAASISPAHGPDFAEAGTNVEYGTTMFYGAAKGQFGTSTKGSPLPWGDIPAREFIGLSDEGAEEGLDILGRYLAGQ